MAAFVHNVDAGSCLVVKNNSPVMIRIHHRQPNIFHARKLQATFYGIRINTSNRLIKRNAAKDLNRLHAVLRRICVRLY